MVEQRRTFTLRVVWQLVLVLLVIPLLPLLISQHWDWWQAWAFAAVSIGGFILSRALAAQRDPSILAERARFAEHKDTAPWDKLLAPAIAFGGGLIPLIAGLDVRFDWSPAMDNLWVEIIALLLVVLGYVIGAYALNGESILLWRGAHPDGARPSRHLHRPVRLGTPSRLCRRRTDFPGHTLPPRFLVRAWTGRPRADRARGPNPP